MDTTHTADTSFMPLLLAIVSAAFGSAGLVSPLITTLGERARQSKSRRFLEEAKVAREVSAKNSAASDVLDQAIITETLRLTAAVFLRKTAIQQFVFWGLIGSLGLALSLIFFLTIVELGYPKPNQDLLNTCAVLSILLPAVIGILFCWRAEEDRKLLDKFVSEKLLETPIVDAATEGEHAQSLHQVNPEDRSWRGIVKYKFTGHGPIAPRWGFGWRNK